MQTKPSYHLLTYQLHLFDIVSLSRGHDQECINERCGGQVVSVLAFYSDNPSSNPAEPYIFFCKFSVWKNDNKQKEAGVGPFLKIKNAFTNLIFRPLLELQLETAMNHHLSLAVLKFLVPLHLMYAMPVLLSMCLPHPATIIADVRLMNWLFSTWSQYSKYNWGKRSRPPLVLDQQPVMFLDRYAAGNVPRPADSTGPRYVVRNDSRSAARTDFRSAVSTSPRSVD